MKRVLYSGFVIAVIIASCTKKNFEEDHPKKVIIVTPNPTTPVAKDTCKDSIRYNPQIKRILDANCNESGCHNGSQVSNLTSYSGAKQFADEIYQRTSVIKDMPQGKDNLGSCDLSKIKAWVDQGAIE